MRPLTATGTTTRTVSKEDSVPLAGICATTRPSRSPPSAGRVTTSTVSGMPSSRILASASFAPTTGGTSTSFGLHGACFVGSEPAT